MNKKMVTHIVSIAVVMLLLAEITYFILPANYARALLVAILGTGVFYIPHVQKKTGGLKPLLGGLVILITAIVAVYLFNDNVIAPQTVWSFIVHGIVLVLAYFGLKKYFYKKRRRSAKNTASR